SGGEVALLVREPVGVVAAIVPWNAAPGAISSKVGPALIAGCTVIVKVSPEAPGAAYILAEACEAAGFPPGVVNILTAERDASVDGPSDNFRNVRVGDPFDPATQMGPLAMRRHRDRVEGYIQKGKAEGAKLATGGGRPAHLDRGFYIEPTVFCNVDNNHTIA